MRGRFWRLTPPGHRAVLGQGDREASIDGKKKIPAEAVELYTQFIHGEISRRAFVNGVKAYAAAGLTASAIIDALMPNYALGQQIVRNDERIKAEYVTVPSPDGYGSI